MLALLSFCFRFPELVEYSVADPRSDLHTPYYLPMTDPRTLHADWDCLHLNKLTVEMN